MATDETSRSIDRTLREISSTLKGIEKVLRTLNQNFVEANRTPSDVVVNDSPSPSSQSRTDESPKPIESSEELNKPRLLGWSMAYSLQREGELIKGDMKREQDDSTWIWTGEIWERIEAPSATSS